jgi:hypothetical protein
MRYFEMPYFQRFSRNHLSAKDFVAYQLQMKKIVYEVKEAGLLERPLKTSDGDALITYYYYDPSDKILYVLAGHLVRKGEPKLDELKAIESYVRQIEGGKS